jgi:hypothetical protein
VFGRLDTWFGGQALGERSVLILAAAAILTGVSSGSASGQTVLENTVKAAYLSKLAAFVDWPPASFETPASPLRICVIGDDPFKATLDRAVNGLTVAGRPVQVARYGVVEAGMACQVAYVVGSAAQSRVDALKALRGQPVLTVTDQLGGGEQGIVSFVVRDSRVRFEIDQREAVEDHLSLSGKLLSLALEVRR